MKSGYVDMTAAEAVTLYENYAKKREAEHNDWESNTLQGIADGYIRHGFLWRKKRKRRMDEAREIFDDHWSFERQYLAQIHKSAYSSAAAYKKLDPTSKVSVPFPIRMIGD